MEQVTASVLDVDYRTGDGLELRLFCVTDDGTPAIGVDTDFQPYFYVIPEPGETDAVMEKLDAVTVEDQDREVQVQAVNEVERVDGRETVTALEVVLAHPPHVPVVKSEVMAWEEVAAAREFDIPFYKRYLIDNDISPVTPVRLTGTRDPSDTGPDRLLLDRPPEPTDQPEQELSMLAFDLEVYEDSIIMCSFSGADTKHVLVRHDDDFDADWIEPVASESALLDRMMEIVQEHDPDILLGYNTDEFDFDMLRNRAEEHDTTLVLGRTPERMTFQRRGRFSGANLEGRIHLDLYAFVENVVSIGMTSETLSLDAVAEELLGENKDDMTWDDIKAAWEEKTELDMLAEYALRDAELTYRLGTNLAPQILSLSRLTGLPPFDTCRHTYGQLVENYLIRAAHAQNILAPNRPSQSERSERYRQGAYAGGFVYEPEKGLHENIALFDFRSLYPTIIVAHNISPDTLDVDGCENEMDAEIPDTGRTYAFCQDTPGFIPGLLEDLVSERYDLKHRIKDLDPGTQRYRNWDNRQNALKILSNAFYGYMGYAGARWYSRPCAEATTALGRKYIQDTIRTAEEYGFDIVYGDTDSIFLTGENAALQTFQEDVNNDLPAFMELEFEGFYPRGLFTYTQSGEGAKKKYALIDEDGNVKITGFEQVRRDWSPIAKETQEAVIRQVLEGNVEAAVTTVEQTIQELESGDVPLDKLKIYTQMKKRPENYKAKTPHTEAAKRAIKRGTDISPGDTIAYVITEGGGAISDRAELLQYADSYDPVYYIENQVIPVALRVLKVLGYTEEQLLGNGTQADLDQFTG